MEKAVRGPWVVAHGTLGTKPDCKECPRSTRGMTQEDLAGAAEIDRSYVSEIENERFSVSADMVEKLANVFGVEIFEMFHPDTAARLEEASGK